jgi:hypothetical protein
MSRRRLTDALTALAARSFPAPRRHDARVVRDCARDAVDGSGLGTLLRESTAVAAAGLRVRAGVAAHDLRHAPWRSGLGVLALPLAAAILCLWTFGFVPRYDHWPLGEGWALLLGGSLAAVVGAALESRWLTVLGAGATFVAAASPYLGMGTEVAIADTPSFFQGWGIDLGAASLIPTLLLAGAALVLPRRPARSVRRALDRLVLGLLPTGIALVELLPRPTPEPTVGFLYDGSATEPTVDFGPPYPMPWLTESETLLSGLGIALAVAVVLSWRAARSYPAPALATGLVLMSLAYPLVWAVYPYDPWPLIVLPPLVALALMRRAAGAGSGPERSVA